MIKRDEVEALLRVADDTLYTSNISVPYKIARELARTWLRVNDAPTGHLRDSIDFDGDTGMDESQARALVGQRIRLVPEADSRGEG